MAQQLKNEVRDRIVSAALDAFAGHGFRAATMAGIARRAGISTGNIYRYFPDKEALFDTVVPASFAREFLHLIRRRVRALEGVTDAARLPAGSIFRVVAEDLLAFSIANRLRVIVLLGQAESTRYEAFSRRLRAELRRLAVEHYRGLGGGVRVPAARRFALERIYDDWLRTMVAILAASRDGAEIRERVEAYSRYHLAGLNALFA